VFGGVISTFQLNPETQGAQLRREGNRYALWCFVIALVSTVAIVVQAWLYGDTAERLCAKVRLRTFKSTLRQDIAFFDRDENSTGALTNAITDRATKARPAALSLSSLTGRKARSTSRERRD